LASEQVQELENLVDSEREKQEVIIKMTTGSMYSGEALYYIITVRVHGTY
jgi:hypothetical protein